MCYENYIRNICPLYFCITLACGIPLNIMMIFSFILLLDIGISEIAMIDYNHYQTLLSHVALGSSSCCYDNNFYNLSSISTGTNLVFHGLQAIFPTLNFASCTDATLSGFIFNGAINDNDILTQRPLILQLWHRESATRYTFNNSWSISKDSIIIRDDGLVQFELKKNITVKSDNTFGLFMPFQDKQVDIHFTRTSSSQFYYRTANSPFTSLLQVNSMTVGDETYPKITPILGELTVQYINNMLSYFCNNNIDCTFASSRAITTPSNTVTIEPSTTTTTTTVIQPSPTPGETSVYSCSSKDSCGGQLTSKEQSSTAGPPATSEHNEMISSSSHVTNDVINPSSVHHTITITSNVTMQDVTNTIITGSSIDQPFEDSSMTYTMTQAIVPSRSSMSKLHDVSVAATIILNEVHNDYYFIQYLIPLLIVGFGIVLTTFVIVSISVAAFCYYSFSYKRENATVGISEAFQRSPEQPNTNTLTDTRVPSSVHYDLPHFYVTPNQLRLSKENDYSTPNRSSRFNLNPAYNNAGGVVVTEDCCIPLRPLTNDLSLSV